MGKKEDPLLEIMDEREARMWLEAMRNKGGAPLCREYFVQFCGVVRRRGFSLGNLGTSWRELRRLKKQGRRARVMYYIQSCKEQVAEGGDKYFAREFFGFAMHELRKMLSKKRLALFEERFNKRWKLST